MILDKIIDSKLKILSQKKEKLPLDELCCKLKKKTFNRRSFKDAISGKRPLGLIAEIKKASPSAGVLKKYFKPAQIAKDYQLYGADAISVITDEKFFLGTDRYLPQVRKAVTLPVLRKDFLIDEYQIYESAYLGADAILLIARILTKEEVSRFASISARFKMDIMAEVHNEGDIDKVLSSGIKIIGINNRDLATFKVDMTLTKRLIRFIPHDRIIVSESGIKDHNDIVFLKDIGVDAVLMGQTLMKSKDLGAEIKAIMGR